MDALRKAMCNWLVDTKQDKYCVLDKKNEILFFPVSGRLIKELCYGLGSLPPDFVLDEDKIVISRQSLSGCFDQIFKLIDVLGLRCENYEGLDMESILYDLVQRVEDLQSNFYKQEEEIDELNKTVDELEKELEEVRSNS